MADKKDGHSKSKDSRTNHNSSHDGCEEDTSLSGGEPSNESDKSAKRMKRRTSSPSTEPRSSKRLRLQYQPFQSPTLHIPQLRPTKSNEEKEVVYVKGEFLALRNESGSFFICQAAQNVYKSSRRFRIRWLSKADNREINVYSRDFYDYTDFECVLTNIQMDRLDKNLFRLPREESVRTESILRKALNLENGVYKAETDVNEIDEPANHKGSSSKEGSRPLMMTRRTIIDSSKGHSSKVDDDNSKKYQVAKDAKVKLQKIILTTRKEGQPITKNKVKLKQPRYHIEHRLQSHKREEKTMMRTKRNLVSSNMTANIEKPKLNTKVTLYNNDPTFESNNPIPYVSLIANSKLLIRAVLMNDIKSLQSMMKCKTNKCWYGVHQSVDQKMDALSHALLKENQAAIEIIMNERKNPAKSAIKMPETMLLHYRVGKSNFKFLGSAVREISLSRGAREGNSALMKDCYDEFSDQVYINLMLQHGVSIETIDLFCKHSSPNPETAKKLVISNFYRAVNYGQRKLAACLIDEALKLDALGFTLLHKEALQLEKQELSYFRPESVTKRSFGNCGIAPVHCAAINPVSKYLKQLIDANPDFNIGDLNGRKPLHYAAACEGPCPMDLLLSRNLRTDEADNEGNLPLHVAAETGQVHNVDLLLKRARTDKRSGDDNKIFIHQGLGGINRANRATYTALHLACIGGHLDVVKSLIKYGADNEKPTGIGKNKATPLMLACQHGHLEIMKFLTSSGAKLDARDKLRRTAMTYAVMNGHAHVVSHLLRMGCDPNQADSSGNSLLHYAVAYGWWYCIKLLLDSGAILNCCNDWKVTPLGIAFLKGHVGLAESLLHQTNIDLEFKDDNGLSYVMLAACSPLIPALVDTFKFLITNKKAKCSDADIHGNTPLHWLACNSTMIDDKQGKIVCEEAVQTSLQMARILLEHECDPTARNHKGQTVLTLAIQQGNNELVKLLLNDGSQVTAEVDDTGENLLHSLVDHSWDNDLSTIIQVIKDSPGKKSKALNGEDSFELNIQNPPTPLLENVDGVLKVGDVVVMKGIINSSSPTFFTSLLQGFDVEKDDVALNCVVKLSDSDVTLTCNGRVNEKWKEAKDIPLPILPTAEQKDRNIDIELAITLQEEQFQVSVGGSAYVDFPVTVTPKQVVCLHVTKDSRLNSVQIQRSAITKTTMPAISLPSDVLREMAQTYSYDGFTPLLLACNKYQFTTDAKQQLCLRKIIKTLIEDSDSEFHAVVKKRSDNKSRNIDGYSVLHFLASATELPESINGVETAAPGLSLLLNFKPPINIQDHRGRTPLITAILRRQSAAAEALINAGANVNLCSGDMDDDGKASPLILAANLGLISVIRLLLKHGANVQMADEKNHSTALHYAVLMKSSNNALEVVRCLLDAGININSTNQDGRTPLHLGVNANSGSTDDIIDIEDLLIERGADLFAKDSLGRLPLHYAFVKIGRPDDSSKIDPIEIVSLLTGAMKSSNLDVVDVFGQTPLHCAAFRGATISCMHLAQSIANLNAKDRNGNSALSLAVFGSHESCAIMLLQKGASVQVDVIVPPSESRKHEKEKTPIWQWKPVAESPRQPKRTPILQEVVHKDWQGVMYMMVGQLQSSGANFFPAIEAALKTGKYKLALNLIARNKGGETVNTFNNSDQNLLHILANIPRNMGCPELQIKVAKVLINCGVSLTRPDAEGDFPLTYAALNKNDVLCEFFTEQLGWEAVIKMAPDKLGRTPLTAVFWNLEPFEWRTSKLKAIRLWCKKLFSHGANCNMLAAFPYVDNCPDDTFVYANRNLDYKSPEPCRITPLIYAVCLHDYELVAFLLQQHVDINLPDEFGRSALMHAVRKNDIGMVKLLLNLNHSYKQDVYSSLEKRRLHKQLYIKNFECSSLHNKTFAKEDSLKTHKFEVKRDGSTPLTEKDNGEIDLSKIKQECDGKSNSDSLAKNEEDNVESEDFKPEENEKPTEIEANGENDEKSNKVCLTKTDRHGWTVVHHLIRPFSCGTYDNVEILQLLADAGARLDISNTAGFSPLKMAVQSRAYQLAAALQKLLNCPAETISNSIAEPSVKDNIHWDRDLWDYKVDAAEVLERVESEAMEEGEDDVVITPDVHSGMEDMGEVVVDSEQNISLDAFMTKVEFNVSGGVCYSFYKMQVISQQGKNLFILFTRWGKLGFEGEYQQIPFSSLEEATKEFCRLFKAKTGNNWQDIKNFQPIAKKYRVIEALRRGRRKLRDISLNLVKDVPSVLSTPLQDLMNTLTNVPMLQEACRDIGLDTAVMPFGRLCDAALQRGRQILRELKNVINEKMKIDIEPKYRERVAELAEKVIDLSSEYFQVIPQHSYAFEKVRPLENLQGVRNYLDNLEYMFHLELVSKLLLGAQLRVKEINPLDYAYRSMDCQLCAMQEDEMEAQYILQYIHNTSLPPKPVVESIYRVSRKEEFTRQSSMKEIPKNRWLLWHGIPAAKVISVFTKGLRASGDQDNSSNAQDDMFKEVRVVDSFEMSRRMCPNPLRQKTNPQFALLCEVLLGKNLDSNTNHCIATDNGYESFSLAGTYFPDPSCNLILSTGVKIPLGTLTCKYNNDGQIIPGQTDFNEYMVTNREQIFIRYLVCYRSDHIKPSYKACKVPTHS